MDLLKRYNQSCGVSEAASEAVRGIPYNMLNTLTAYADLTRHKFDMRSGV